MRRSQRIAESIATMRLCEKVEQSVGSHARGRRRRKASNFLTHLPRQILPNDGPVARPKEEATVELESRPNHHEATTPAEVTCTTLLMT